MRAVWMTLGFCAAWTPAIAQTGQKALPYESVGRWTIFEDRSPIDDKVTYLARLRATEGFVDRYGTRHLPTLWATCREGSTAFYIDFDGAMMTDRGPNTFARIRLDKEEPTIHELDASSDRSALGSSRHDTAVRFLKSMQAKTAMLIEVAPVGEPRRITKFELTGASDALTSIRINCHW